MVGPQSKTCRGGHPCQPTFKINDNIRNKNKMQHRDLSVMDPVNGNWLVS